MKKIIIIIIIIIIMRTVGRLGSWKDELDLRDRYHHHHHHLFYHYHHLFYHQHQAHQVRDLT